MIAKSGDIGVKVFFVFAAMTGIFSNPAPLFAWMAMDTINKKIIPIKKNLWTISKNSKLDRINFLNLFSLNIYGKFFFWVWGFN
ncbi:MAG: hypothetical protein CM15mP15_3400 [Prochlorococcus sp.]|nr:MAG: hypothetical protein CM15mP15_3400 [Prochlorococcus sp.]